MKLSDKYIELIHSKYYEWIRTAITKHGKINVQSLSHAFGISSGNTYFRNFIKFDNSPIGISGLTNILDKCGYTFRLVPIKKNDVLTLTAVEKITNDAFKCIRDDVSEIAESQKKVKKTEIDKSFKPVANSNLINFGIMSDDSPMDDDFFDEDELLIGSEDDMFELDIDVNRLADKIIATDN